MEDRIYNKFIIHRESFFWSPNYLDVSAWIEHIPFAFWIIDVFKPKVVVELGVHNGTSYFAFCQAVKNINTNSVCYGIDTWKGDEHAGYYNEQTYNKVAAYNSSQYYSFSTLIRASFDEAKDYFSDGTIELLHIDGLHTYEAVKHDFETWLPKLAPNAIIIFHDINVRERNFGVFKLWEELKHTYQHFHFDFGYGLGIIVLGNNYPEELEVLLNTSKYGAYYIFLRNIFSDRGNAFKVNFQLREELTQEREDVAIQKATCSLINEKHQLLVSENEKLKEDSKNFEIKCKCINELNASLVKIKEDLIENIKRLEAVYSGLDKKYHAVVFSNENLSKSNLMLQLDMDKLNNSLNQASKELAQIKMENNTLLKNIEWYKATFVNRSMLGVLKEKLMKKH